MKRIIPWNWYLSRILYFFLPVLREWKRERKRKKREKKKRVRERERERMREKERERERMRERERKRKRKREQAAITEKTRWLGQRFNCVRKEGRKKPDFFLLPHLSSFFLFFLPLSLSLFRKLEEEEEESEMEKVFFLSLNRDFKLQLLQEKKMQNWILDENVMRVEKEHFHVFFFLFLSLSLWYTKMMEERWRKKRERKTTGHYFGKKSFSFFLFFLGWMNLNLIFSILFQTHHISLTVHSFLFIKKSLPSLFLSLSFFPSKKYLSLSFREKKDRLCQTERERERDQKREENQEEKGHKFYSPGQETISLLDTLLIRSMNGLWIRKRETVLIRSHVSLDTFTPSSKLLHSSSPFLLSPWNRVLPFLSILSLSFSPFSFSLSLSMSQHTLFSHSEECERETIMRGRKKSVTKILRMGWSAITVAVVVQFWPWHTAWVMERDSISLSTSSQFCLCCFKTDREREREKKERNEKERESKRERKREMRKKEKERESKREMRKKEKAREKEREKVSENPMSIRDWVASNPIRGINIINLNGKEGCGQLICNSNSLSVIPNHVFSMFILIQIWLRKHSLKISKSSSK